MEKDEFTQILAALHAKNAETYEQFFQKLITSSIDEVWNGQFDPENSAENEALNDYWNQFYELKKTFKEPTYSSLLVHYEFYYNKKQNDVRIIKSTDGTGGIDKETLSLHDIKDNMLHFENVIKEHMSQKEDKSSIQTFVARYVQLEEMLTLADTLSNTIEMDNSKEIKKLHI